QPCSGADVRIAEDVAGSSPPKWGHTCAPESLLCIAPTPREPRYALAMSDNSMSGQRRLAFDPESAIGSIHRTNNRFHVKLLDAPEGRSYPTLDVAKSALHATLPAGADWPEFREH